MSVVYRDSAQPNIQAVLRNIISRTERISGLELSKRTGLPVATVNRLLAGTVTDPRASTLKPLASYFGISMDQLLGYAPLPTEYESEIEKILPSTVIPVHTCNNFQSLQQKPYDWFTWVTESTSNKKQTFALLVDHEELQPLFAKETVLIVEPHKLPAQHNDYVAMVFANHTVVSVRKFVLDSEEVYFVPINPRLKATHSQEKNHTLLGVITETHSKLRI
jgi:transcriptional regulator with XRE-family HTH domain